MFSQVSGQSPEPGSRGNTMTDVAGRLDWSTGRGSRVVVPGPTVCRCGGGTRSKLAKLAKVPAAEPLECPMREDTTETLEVIPRHTWSSEMFAPERASSGQQTDVDRKGRRDSAAGNDLLHHSQCP